MFRFLLSPSSSPSFLKSGISTAGPQADRAPGKTGLHQPATDVPRPAHDPDWTSQNGAVPATWPARPHGTARQFGRCCSRKQSLLALEVPSATWGPREAAAVHELWCVWQSHLMTCAWAPGGSRSGQRRHIPPTHCHGVARDGHARLSAMQVGVVPPLLRKGFPGLPEQRTLLSSTS